MSKIYSDAERKANEEKKNDLITRAESIVNSAKTEKRELTPDEMQELAEIRDDVKKIKEALGLDDDFRALEDAEAKPDAEPKEEEMKDTERACGEQEKRALEKRELEETKMFEEYIRGTLNERANNMDKTNNGAVIPQTIANKIIKRVYDISPVLDRSSKYNIKGTLTIPYYDESVTHITVDYQTEFEEMASNSGKFTSSVTLTGFLAGALVKVSRSLINNSQFNIVDHVVDLMAEAIARWIDKELLVGTNDAITGLKTLTNSVTSASASAITADEVVKLHDKVKDVYQRDAIWVMSPATRTALRLLKDEMGRYLLQDDISSPFGVSLLGKPVYVSDQMEDIATGKTVIYYGDFKGLATKFSENISIEVLRERFATQHAVGVVAWFEMDAKVEDAQKIAKLVMA
jgi:HK97 family phage major capsid protein